MSSSALPKQSLYLVGFTYFEDSGSVREGMAYKGYVTISLCMTEAEAEKMLEAWSNQLALEETGEGLLRAFQKRFGVSFETYEPLIHLSSTQLDDILNTGELRYVYLYEDYHNHGYKNDEAYMEEILDAFNTKLKEGRYDDLSFNPKSGFQERPLMSKTAPWPVHPFTIYEALPEFSKEKGYNDVSTLAQALIKAKSPSKSKAKPFIRKEDHGHGTITIHTSNSRYEGFIDRIDPSKFCP